MTCTITEPEDDALTVMEKAIMNALNASVPVEANSYDSRWIVEAAMEEMAKSGYELVKKAPPAPLTVADVPIGAWFEGDRGDTFRREKDTSGGYPRCVCADKMDIIAWGMNTIIKRIYPAGTTFTFTQGGACDGR